MPSGRFDRVGDSRTSGESLVETLERLHRTPPQFKDESLAPDVDRPLLVALVRQQLSVEEARLVYRLIHSFASWNAAHAEVLIEEFHRRRSAATE